MHSLTVSLKPAIELTDEQFFQLCQKNRDLRFERNAQGDLIIMAPAGSDTGRVNSEFGADLVFWNRRAKLGVTFDSSAGFKLPNGSDRSPDAAWILTERWEALTVEQREKFAPICPDFVMELISPSDNLKAVQEEMREYQENGVRLGWLINRKDRQVEIYRLDGSVEILQSPTSLSGEDVLPGFTHSLEAIW
jgi:Uma2 family endonuclease